MASAMNCIILAASLLFLAAKVNYVLVRNYHAEYPTALPETNGGLIALRSAAENSRKYTPNSNGPQLSLITIKRRRRKFTSLSVQPGPISTKNIITKRKPGPETKRKPRFPGTVCERGVVSRIRALSCDDRNDWTHIKCSGCMTSAVYDQLVLQDKECYFLCDKCLSKNLPFNDHTCNIDDDETRATGTVRTDDAVDGSDCESDFQVVREKGQHIIHINARSLRNKPTDMRILAKKTNASRPYYSGIINLVGQFHDEQ